MSHACERRILAEGGLGKVEACSCGLIHLELAALTLRLEPAALQDLARTLVRASHRLAGVQVEPPQASFRTSEPSDYKH